MDASDNGPTFSQRCLGGQSRSSIGVPTILLGLPDSNAGDPIGFVGSLGQRIWGFGAESSVSAFACILEIARDLPCLRDERFDQTYAIRSFGLMGFSMIL